MAILLLPLWLMIAPPSEDYGQAVTELEQAIERGGQDGVAPAESIPAIERSLAAIEHYPDQLPNDTEAQADLVAARLSLVWLHLLDGDDAGATVAMDEAIRSAQGRALTAGRFGPKVQLLYEQRTEALQAAGTGLIEVDCGKVECQIVVNEQRVPNPTSPLFLGTYRVWITARDGSVASEFHEVELSNEGVTETVTYQAGVNLRLAPEPVQTPDVIPAAPKRMLPRWLESTSLVVGVGLAVAGGVLLSFDGNCQNDARPDSPDLCPTVYRTAPLSYALIASGAGVTLLSGIMLSVDEVRVGRAKGRQAMLTWTGRF